MPKLRYPYEPPEYYWDEPFEARHIGHSNHLCEMAENGDVSLSTFKELVKNPRFICKKCGRAAGKEDNLCEPVPL